MSVPHIIKVDIQKTGPGYTNQEWLFDEPIPEGYAVIPEDMFPPENYPFGDAKVEKVNGILTVTAWTPLDAPEDVIVKKQTYKDIVSDTVNEI